MESRRFFFLAHLLFGDLDCHFSLNCGSCGGCLCRSPICDECMEDLPMFTIKLKPNVGRHSIHGAHGCDTLEIEPSAQFDVHIWMNKMNSSQKILLLIVVLILTDFLWATHIAIILVCMLYLTRVMNERFWFDQGDRQTWIQNRR